MMPDYHTVVIARPGYYRTSLVALLATFPQISSVKTFDEASQALEAASGLAPDLVLLEANPLDQSLLEAMGLLRELWPAARRIIIAERIRQLKPAGSFEADFVLTKDVSTGEFLRLVERLLGAAPKAKKSLADQAILINYSQ